MSIENVLRFTPPGFSYSIDVPFPCRCLPVCARCKKNYKTREHCRTRDCHKSPPWSETFMCITLDASCTGANGKLLEMPFIARPIPDQPYCLRGNIGPTTPICAPCKDKNYTRTHCRTNKQHKQLPWSTVYVILSPARPRVASFSANREGTKNDAEKASICGVTTVGNAKRRKIKEINSFATLRNKDDSEESGFMNKNNCDDIDDIATSKTFVATVSAETCTIHWLDLDPIIQTVISQVPRTKSSGDETVTRLFPGEHGIRNSPLESLFDIEQDPYSQIGPSTYAYGGMIQAPLCLYQRSYSSGTPFSLSTVAQCEQQISNSSARQASAEEQVTCHQGPQRSSHRSHHQIFQSQINFDNQRLSNNGLQLEFHPMISYQQQQMLQSQIAIDAQQQLLLTSRGVMLTQHDLLQLQQVQLQQQQLQLYLLQPQQDTTAGHIALQSWVADVSLQEPEVNDFQSNVSSHSDPSGSHA